MAGKSKGRQKIEMTKMSKESNLLVTFSKRRSGLFKKASELCILCDAEIAIIVFSPAKKVFCFGHPCVFTLINRYLNNDGDYSPTTGRVTSQSQLAVAHGGVKELNMQMMEMSEQLDMEKKKGDELKKIRKENDKKKCWWVSPISDLGLQELEVLKEAMEELKKNVDEKIMIKNSIFENYFKGSTSSSSTPSPCVDAKVLSGLGFAMANPACDNLFGFDRCFF